MITIHFKNVGQGDSIIIEWINNGRKCVGLIDCHVYNGFNPSLDYLKNTKTSNLEFIVLSHFHNDHFSGFADLFSYCIENKIVIKSFYHSLAPFLGDFYTRIFTSQRLKASIKNFFEAYERFSEFVDDSIPVSSHVNKVELTSTIHLSFLAPRGNIYDKMAKQLSRKVNKITTTAADINKLSTVILINNQQSCVLLTADAVARSFLNTNITSELVLAQAPHHGSWKNINVPFWKDINKIKNCPIVFSVGDEPQDKLPNVETVAFYNTEGYDVHATNEVYGIAEFANSVPNSFPAISATVTLNSFSKLKRSYSAITALTSSKLNGDQVFSVL